MTNKHHRHHQDNKAVEEDDANNNKNKKTSPPSFMDKVFRTYVPLFILVSFVAFATLFAIGLYIAEDELDDTTWGFESFYQNDDDESGGSGKKEKKPSGRIGDPKVDEDGNEEKDLDITTNFFIVPKTCTPEQLFSSMDFVRGNMTKIVTHFLEKHGKDETLNDWIKKMYDIKVHNDRVERERKNKIPGKDGEEEQTFDQDKRVTKLIYEMVRWAKSAKGFQLSVEKHCDLEKVMDKAVATSASQHYDDQMEESSSTTNSENNINNNNDEQKKKDTRVLLSEFAHRKVLPSLYTDLIKLLHFVFGVKTVNNNNNEYEPFTGKPDSMSRFAEKVLEQTPEFVTPHLNPVRDVLIRILMSMSDVAFALDNEEYHSAFMYHVIRFTDNLATKHIKKDKKEHYTKKSPTDAKDKEALAALKAATPFFNNILPQLSCASPQAAFMCTLKFGTKLVRAKGGLQYDQDPTDDSSTGYNAYLFGLLRSAFLEELIALRNSYAPIRVAYGYSLLELQRYETAQTALSAALRMMNDEVVENTDEAGGITNDEQAGSILRQQNPLIADSVTKVLAKLTSCFEKDAVIEHTGDLQRRATDNLRIFEKWHYWVAEGELGAKKCGNSDENDNNNNFKITVEDLKRSTMMAWPLSRQKYDGTIVNADDEMKREFVPLFLI